MTEKLESLEQAAREFIETPETAGRILGGLNGFTGTYSLTVRELAELLVLFAAERERQVWAEATELVDAEAGRIQGGADPNFTILRLMGKFRERGEQVK